MNAAAQADAFPFGQPLSTEPAPIDWLDVLPPEAVCLRDYQAGHVGKIAQALRAGSRRIVAQSPTGSGKTHEIAAIVAAAITAELPVLVLATRTRLVRQLSERCATFGIRHGVIAAAATRKADFSAKVQIASVDTLHRRAIVGRQMPLPPAAVVIFDEAHLAAAETRLGLLERYPDAIWIGFTATPARKSGKSLGSVFHTLIPGPSSRLLTELGCLVPLRIYNTPIVTSAELNELPTDADRDYQSTALSSLLNRPKLVGDIVQNWLRIANGKRTLVFAVNKAHAASLLEGFQQRGVPAEMMTDDDDETTRDAVIGRLESGSTLVVINCFLASYGTDIPSVEVIQLARPTRSLVLFLQMVGRGRRPSSETGKTVCTLIDHGHCCEALGLPQGDFEWTLDEQRNVNREAMERARKTIPESTRTCGECGTLWLTSEQGNSCPSCGWKPTPRARAVEVQPADLEEMADELTIHPNDPQVMRFFQEALGYRQKHSPQKWLDKPKGVRWACWCAVKEKFKLTQEQPPGRFWDLPALPAGLEVQGWMKYRDIRWARSKRRAA